MRLVIRYVRKYMGLLGALETLLDDGSLTACGGPAHDPSLVVEVTACGLDLELRSDAAETAYLRMTKMPPPSGPSVFSTGTRTLSKVMYAVPAVDE